MNNASPLDTNDVKRLLDIALGALADIGQADDMTLEVAQRKAMRVYTEIRKEYAE